VIPMMRCSSDSRPRFEYYPPDCTALCTVHVETVPFTIGRGESTDLQIASTSVSREHAQLVRTSSGYRLKDLGSTNGTEINGRPITDAVLADGDAVRIADVDLTFLCSSMGRLQRIVTQPLRGPRRTAHRGPLDEVTLATRALQEALLWQAIPIRWTHLVQTGVSREQTVFAAIDEPLASLLNSSTMAESSVVVPRIQSLSWRIAMEQVAARIIPSRLMLEVRCSASLDQRDDLLDTLDLGPTTCQRGVVMPWEWTASSTAAQRLCADLRSAAVAVAIDGFAGGPQGVAAMQPAAPDLLVLDPRFVCGVATQPRRLQQLENVLAECDTQGITLVLPPGLTGNVHAMCADVGIQAHLQPGQHASDQESDVRRHAIVAKAPLFNIR